MLLTLCLILPLIHAIQPGAAPASPAPLRPLDFGDINFLHTTDTHGWHAGHLLEPSYSADWGDYISFTHHLRNRLAQQHRDLLIIDTGDRIEGNGLYDASHPRGKYTFPILRTLPFDLLSVGNHELYKNSSASDDFTRLVPHTPYLATNLDIYVDGKQTAFADRYRIFTTQFGIKILAFGFIFDFTRNDKNTVVTPVGTVVTKPWFRALVASSEVDLILVVGHVALRQAEMDVIYNAIRTFSSKPIHIFGGHFHIRDYRVFDDKARALASGRFMETIGFASISGLKNADGTMPDSSSDAEPGSGSNHGHRLTFSRRYIDNNLYSLMQHSNTTASNFHTDAGLRTSRMITHARHALELDQTFGCAPRTYWMSRTPYPHPSSIFSLLTDEVFPSVENPARRDKSRVVITNTGAIRFDIFEGAFTRDSTFIVSPFTSNLSFVPDVPWGRARRILGILNGGEPPVDEVTHAEWEEVDFMALVAPEVRARREIIPKTPKWQDESVIDETTKEQTLGMHQRITPGYTTHDDLGDHGDDTVHSPVEYFDVPNCVQTVIPRHGSRIRVGEATEENADDELVDLVFNEFLKPYVLSILNFGAGGKAQSVQKKYVDEDVQNYVPGQTFTTVLANWVAENWPCEGQKKEL